MSGRDGPDAPRTELRFGLLGPVCAARSGPDGETDVDLGPAKQRAVLAVLALSAGSPVSRTDIIEFLWPDGPPPAAVNAVQTYIKRLRRILEPERPPRTASRVLPARRSGYLLAAGPQQVDVLRFRDLVRAAREADQRDAPEEGAELRHAGLRLWRDRPLADIGPLLRLHPKVTALEQERLGAAVDYLDAELNLERAAAVLPWLEGLAGEHPLHEPLQSRLIRAYHACGRHAEALTLFARISERLRDELGVDPGSELCRAHEQVLRWQEPVPTRGVRWRGPRPSADPLVGRDADLERLEALLRSRRLITLTGAGGTGKTTLGLTVAHRVADGFPAGVRVIELGLVPPDPDGSVDGDVDLLAGTVAAGLGVRVSGRHATSAVVARALQGSEQLIVLDNAEHVVHSCAGLVDHLARACPSVTVLVTSRRPLGVAGETVWDVMPLPVPEDGAGAERLRGYPAVELFLRRVDEACPDLDLSDQMPLVGRLCRRLDGLPLAIELAAARLRGMSLGDLDARLTRQPSMLSGGEVSRLPHQRAVETTIEWSRRLLTPWQRLLLGRLAVLSGTFTLQTVERVCGFAPLTHDEVAPLLADLVDGSLVQPIRDREYRYRLLTPIREFTRRRAEPADLRATRRRHLAWCVSLARETESAGPHDRPARMAAVRAELDDVLAALAWAFDPASDSDRRRLGARLLAANRAVWDADPGNLDTIWYWTRRALERLDELPRELRARLLHWAGRLTWLTGHPVETRSHLTQALAQYDLAAPEERRYRVDALIGLAAVADRLADPGAATYAREVIDAARTVGDRGMLVKALADMGYLLAQWGWLAEGREAVREARRRAGDDPLLRRSCDYREAALCVMEERPDASLAAADRVLADANGPSPTVLIDLLGYRGWARLQHGDIDGARAELVRALDEVRRSNRQLGAAYPLHALAHVEYLAGRWDGARAQLRACLESCLRATDRLTAVHAVTLAGAVACAQRWPEAPRLVALGAYCREQAGVPLWQFSAEDGARWPRSADPQIPDSVDDHEGAVIGYAAETVLNALER